MLNMNIIGLEMDCKIDCKNTFLFLIRHNYNGVSVR